MKPVIGFIVALFLGLGLGWYFEHYRAQREKAQIIQQMVEAGESSDGERAARAIRAIEVIQSGETQQAVELLSWPISHYYSVYGAAADNDRRLKLRSLIEGLARTNEVVAARIAEAATNSQLRPK